ncbi:hypothetical protein LTR85_010962 [Meristemomyces frigidus]|nr:hypothetical protein LTR85_010962 [Meristemomyces frigidus]
MAVTDKLSTAVLFFCATAMCVQKGRAAAAIGASSSEQLLLIFAACLGIVGGSTFFATAVLLCSGVFNKIMGPRQVQALSVTTSFVTSLTTTSTALSTTSTFVDDDPYGAMGVCNGNCTWLWELDHNEGPFGSGAGSRLLRDLGASIKSAWPLLLLLAVIWLFVQAAAVQHNTTAAMHASKITEAETVKHNVAHSARSHD